MKTQKLFAAIVATLAISMTAQAGGNVENGGDGVISGQRILSLDLVERGLEDNPYISETLEIPAEVQALAEKFLRGKVSTEVSRIVVNKLARMQKSHRATLFKSVEEILKTYELIFVNAPLKALNDQNSPIDDRVMVRLAVHSPDNHTLQINKSGFERMNEAHQAALIIHELVYASTSDKTSRASREITALLFSPDASDDTLEDRYRIALRRNWGEACVARPKRRVCQVDYSQPEVIAYGDLTSEYVARYAVPLVLPPVKKYGYMLVPAVGPKREDHNEMGHFIILLGTKASFVMGFYWSMQELSEETRNGVSESGLLPIMAGMSYDPITFQNRTGNYDMAGSYRIENGRFKGTLRDGSGWFELAMVKMPNGKYLHFALIKSKFLKSHETQMIGVLSRREITKP